MINGINNENLRNLMLVALLAIIMLFTAFHEGYLPSISLLFWISLIAGFSISSWLAFSISNRRLLSLILVIFIIEYIKEAIGIRSKLWVYHGINGHFNFGVWAWVLGGVVTYTLATKVAIRLIRKLKFSPPKWLNPIILLFIFFSIPLTMGDYIIEAGVLLWSFYILVLIVGIYVSTLIDFPVFAGIVVTAWLIGYPSEYAGSVPSKIWTFVHNPDYPPFFLVFGCWPLEILAQYSLSAVLAKETLDKDTF